MRRLVHDLIHRPARLALAVVVIASLSACRRPEPVELRPSIGAVAARALQGAAQQESSRSAAAAPTADAPSAPVGESASAPVGYVPVEVVAQLGAEQGNALLLVELPQKKRFVPIFVGGTEALSIRLRLDGEKYARPLTHDLLDALLRQLGAKLDSVQVDELRNDVFIGTVVVRDRDGVRRTVDARPSDAVALAVGNRVPIFMARKVIDRAGHPIDEELDSSKAERPADATRL
jgi:hypothetical protein